MVLEALANRGLLANLSMGCLVALMALAGTLDGEVMRDLLLATMLANWHTAVLVRYGSESTEDL
jgi:hypothetical protein